MTISPPGTRLERAFALHQAGDLVGAEALYRRILRDSPDDFDALHLLGVLRDASGDGRQGAAFIRRALRLRPGFAPAWSNLGSVLLSAGDEAGAEDALRRAVAVDPAFVPARINLAKLLLDRGEHDTALIEAEVATRIEPGEPQPRLLVAEVLEARGDTQAAEVALRMGIALGSADAAPRTNLGNLLAAAGRHAEAIAAHRKATDLAPASAIAWYGLASALRGAGEVPAALTAAETALRLDPKLADGWNLKGAILRALGRFDAAIAAFEEAVRLRPGFTQAIRHIAISRRAQPDTDEAARLRALLDGDGLSEGERIATGFALGKVLDDLEETDAAFAAFAEANGRVAARLAPDGLEYDPARFVAEARAALAPWAADPAPYDGELPLLVVGMPRAATTLIEQILASHPAVAGAGELTALSLACSTDVRSVAASYVEALRPYAAPGALRVTDKMPDNILLLNRLAAGAPRARAIICRRDPRDVALSCFTTRFAAGNAFAYDLRACGHRAAVTTALAEALDAQLPMPHLLVDYEALVADLEGQARRLIAFAGLDWDARCLDFHATERPVLTASAWQVRQKLFTGSVGRWRRYERHLGPMLEGVAAGEADARDALR